MMQASKFREKAQYNRYIWCNEVKKQGVMSWCHLHQFHSTRVSHMYTSSETCRMIHIILKCHHGKLHVRKLRHCQGDIKDSLLMYRYRELSQEPIRLPWNLTTLPKTGSRTSAKRIRVHSVILIWHSNLEYSEKNALEHIFLPCNTRTSQYIGTEENWLPRFLQVQHKNISFLH